MDEKTKRRIDRDAKEAAERVMEAAAKAREAHAEKEWCLRMANLEGDAEIGAGISDAELTALRAENARLREALGRIASHKKTLELETKYDVDCADFEAGYDLCIDVARAALEDSEV